MGYSLHEVGSITLIGGIMNVIVRFFLHAKHWQIFILLLGVSFFAQLAAMSSFAAARSAEDFGPGPLFIVMTVLLLFCFLGWFWAMGSFLSSIVPASLRLRTRFFRFALVYPAVYIFAFIAFFEHPIPAMFAIIFPFHLFAMYCIFYNLYFVSKSLVMAETGKPALFYDYAGPFFLIWFFPIGVWFIQPRINRIYALKGSAEPSNEPNGAGR